MNIRLKRNDKIGLFFFVAFVISMSLLWLFEERFDENRWKIDPSKRYIMVDDIVEGQLLIGKTKAEVIQLLGKPNSSASLERDLFLYRIGKPPSFFDAKEVQLLILFDNNLVIEVTEAEE